LNILWVCTDKSAQCISHFDNLRLAVEDLANVTVVMKSQKGMVGKTFAEGIYSGKIKDEIVLDKYDERDFDFLICDALFAFPNERWDRFKNIPKAYIVEDLHGDLPKKQTDISINNKFDICFTRYLRPLKKFHPRVSKHQKVLWLPHSVPEYYFVEFFPIDKKPIDILLTGSVNSYYPFRQQIEKIFESNPRFERVSRYRGDDEVNRNPIGMQYLELLNSAKIHPACGATVEYVVCKYAEIAASNTMIISPWFEELGDYGFINGQNIVIADNRNMRNKIDYYLSNDEKRYEITENGRKLIQEKHTCRIRSSELLKHLEEF